jgi:hypothetical protein
MDPEEQMTDEDREFAAAFEADEAGSGPGLDPADADLDELDEDAAGAAPAADGDQAPAGAEDATLPDGAAPAAAPAEEDEIEKEKQRLRSWEGRLKAREKELESGGSREAASDKLEDVSDKAAAGGSDELAAAAAAAAEAVESGEMSPDEAMRQLEEDFGSEFTGMVKSIAMATAKQAVDEVSKRFEESELRRHYEAVAEAHPDYDQVAASPEFKAYVDGLPDKEKAAAIKVVEAGNARQVVSLLSSFKAKASAAPAADTGAPAAAGAATGAAPAKAASSNSDADDEAASSLEGVRSGGVRVPEKPATANQGYEEAWEAF